MDTPTRGLILHTVLCPKCMEPIDPPAMQSFGYDRPKAAATLTAPLEVKCLFGQGRPNSCGWKGTAVFARWSEAPPVAVHVPAEVAKPGAWDTMTQAAKDLLQRPASPTQSLT